MGKCVDILTEIKNWMFGQWDVPSSQLAQESTLDAVSEQVDILQETMDDLYDSTRLHNDVVDETKSVTWNSSSTANTLKVVNTINMPSGRLDRIYALEVTNPSLETDIVVCVYTYDYIGGNYRYLKLVQPYTISASPDNNNPDTVNKVNGEIKLIHGAMGGNGIAVSIYNVSSCATSFTTHVKLREAD